MPGTKHWTTGRLKDLVTGKYILTYPNTPNGIFQQGTGYEFNLPTYQDEKNSPDCNSKYYNTEKSQSFVRDNCGSDSTGSTVVYTVPAGRYSSDISQSAADQLAISDINTNGQNNANTNGTCNLKPTYTATRTQSFTRNNCGQNYTGSSVSYSKSYTSIVSQQDANNKASGDASFVTEGQAKANNEGTCTLIPTPTTFVQDEASSYCIQGYGNQILSNTFTKNNCTQGTGSQVTYTIAENTYYSDTQVKANQLAQNDINANGQAYANNNGTCTLQYNSKLEVRNTSTYGDIVLSYNIYDESNNQLVVSTTGASPAGGLDGPWPTDKDKGFNIIKDGGTLRIEGTNSGDTDDVIGVYLNGYDSSHFFGYLDIPAHSTSSSIYVLNQDQTDTIIRNNIPKTDATILKVVLWEGAPD